MLEARSYTGRAFLLHGNLFGGVITTQDNN
jgi:hypothetical protein